MELEKPNQSYDFKIMRAIICPVIEKIERNYHGEKVFAGIQSGLLQLDEITNGFQKSELTIIGARPSVGKTALALTMAHNSAVRKHIPAAVFSLERPDMQFTLHLISAEAQISLKKIRTGALLPNDFQSLQNAAGVIYESPLYIVDTPNMTLPDLCAAAHHLRMQKHVEIIFIDYINLITSGNRLIPRHEHIAEIVQSLKNLARDLDIPVVAFTQIQRDVEDNPPALDDLREFGSIEQDADVVLFIHKKRTNISSQDGDPTLLQDAQIIVAKQRNGLTGIAEVLFFPQYKKFVNKSNE